MSLLALQRPLPQAALSYQFLSAGFITEAEAGVWRFPPAYMLSSSLLPVVVLKGSSITGALQNAASVQAVTDRQPLFTTRPVQPAAGVQRFWPW